MDIIIGQSSISYEESKWLPLLLSTIAGLSTCIGAGIVFLFKNGKAVSPSVMSFSMALAGSVMVTVSVISIGPECIFAGHVEDESLHFVGLFELVQRVASFGMGGALYCFLSWFVFPEPDDILGFNQVNQFSEENINDRVNLEPIKSSIFIRGDDLGTQNQKRSWRIALLLFISLLFHNFPEGLAVAATTISSTKLGITVMLGIMIHNIPEGIAIAIPCLKARPNQPWLAFGLASISGLAEPLGAWVALVVLRWGEEGRNTSMGNVLSFVAGIMITVSFYELFPEGRRHFKTNISTERNNENLDVRIDLSETAVDKHIKFDSNAVKAYKMGLISGFLIMTFTDWFMGA